LKYSNNFGPFFKKKNSFERFAQPFFSPHFVSIGSGENLPKKTWNFISRLLLFFGPRNIATTLGLFSKKKFL